MAVRCGDRLVGHSRAHLPDVQILLNSGISFTAEAEATDSGCHWPGPCLYTAENSHDPLEERAADRITRDVGS